MSHQPVNESTTDPLVIARTALKECLGFVEAWQLHLADTGKDAAAKTVSEVLANARQAYLNSGAVIAQEAMPADDVDLKPGSPS